MPIDCSVPPPCLGQACRRFLFLLDSSSQSTPTQGETVDPLVEKDRERICGEMEKSDSYERAGWAKTRGLGAELASIVLVKK